MLEKRYAGIFVAAIIAIVIIWAGLFHPTWDYYPPDSMVDSLERSWLLFHLFFVIEFADVFATTLFTGVMGSVGVFIGIAAYERTAGDKLQEQVY